MTCSMQGARVAKAVKRLPQGPRHGLFVAFAIVSASLGQTRRDSKPPKRGQVHGRTGPMSEEEHVASQIGAKASEMAGEIELTARDLARVGQEATALAGALAAKVASVVGSRPEDAASSEISQQAHEVAEAMQRTTADALRIAQKAVEMASRIAQAASRGSDTSPGEEPRK